MSKSLLEIKDLKVSFFNHSGEVKAIRGVSFDVKEGEILGIVGESGSGKSVTSLSVMRLLKGTGKVTNGEIIYKGENLLEKSGKEMMKIRGNDIAMIFQDPMTSLNPVFKVGDQISDVIRRHQGLNKKEARKKAIEMLKMVGIPSPEERYNNYPHEFNGGQRQRIGIARALSTNPEFILCDEPISALDVSIQAQVVNMLGNLQEEMGLTYLFIAHDLSMVRHISYRIGVMYLGKLIEIGPSEEIYKHPVHPYTQALLSSALEPDPRKAKGKRIRTLEGDVPSPLNPPSGCKFATRCKYATEKCREIEPELREISSGHFVACHLI